MPETVNMTPVELEKPVAEVPTKDTTVGEDDPTAGNENIVSGPVQELGSYTEKKLKTVLKEGGKRGVEIEGAADMGGLQFFCTMMGSEITTGDVTLLVESMKAMNAASDPTEEERKGGAGKLGKMIFSYTDECLAAVAYVPKDKVDKISAKEWLTDLVSNLASPKLAESEIKTFDGISDRSYACVAIKKDGGANVFPIKMRDPAITIANTYLRKLGLFPEDDDEDDDEYVFGDEDFP